MRFLFYSPDSYGLGHVRRSISLVGRLLRDFRESSALLLTGAPRAHYFRYPPHCDWVKLPSIDKDGDGQYVTREIGLPIELTVALRARLIDETAASFGPDVLVVDHSPLGLGGEVLPALRRLSSATPPALRVLGMRDVIDEPEAVRAAWARDGVVEVLRTSYDLILVYGQRELFDPITAYGIPDDVASKMVFVGYVPRRGGRVLPADLVTRYAPRTGRLVLVTLGGGGDGNLLLRSVLQGYERLGAEPPFEVLAVTGPLMSPGKRDRFASWARKLPGCTVAEHLDHLPDAMRAASVVVSMGGYNTICELACAAARAIVVPRTFPRKEQLLRASRLADRGMLRMIDPAQATPERLMQEIAQSFGDPRPPRRFGLEFSALKRTSEALSRFLPGADGRMRERAERRTEAAR